MNTFSILLISALCACAVSVHAQPFESDVIETSAGDLEMFFIGHGTLMFAFNEYIIHIDPVTRGADYSQLPKADLVLVTHAHGDHLDPKALEIITTDKTKIFCNAASADKIEGETVLENGDTTEIAGLKIEAVPAYNLGETRFHPKGRDNGYVITFGETRVYVAGDTENIPEMKKLKDITVAFLPMNRPYTMTPEMAANAAKTFRPKILYPYHFGDTDTSELVELLKDEKDIEVRIRDLS